jgi:hypothetical protein
VLCHEGQRYRSKGSDIALNSGFGSELRELVRCADCVSHAISSFISCLLKVLTKLVFYFGKKISP